MKLLMGKIRLFHDILHLEWRYLHHVTVKVCSHLHQWSSTTSDARLPARKCEHTFIWCGEFCQAVHASHLYSGLPI